VSERDVTHSDSDIEFDFFDEPPTREGSREQQTVPPRRRRMPTRPPAGGGQGLFRLAILIGAAILLAVILVLWVNSCREGQKRAEYSDYMEEVQAVGLESENIGKELNTLITTPGIRLGDLQTQLEGLRQQQAQQVVRAQGVSAPGPLREQHESFVESLQFRVSGLAGLAQAFGEIEQGAANDPQAAGALLAEQSDRLIASDVVYEDLFRAGSTAVLRQQSVSGVPVPDSNFVQGGNTDLVSARNWSLIVERVTQGPEAAGPRGNQVDGVRVQPADTPLSTDEENTITASDELAFQVIVTNSGVSQETQVPVKLTIQLSPQPVTQEQVIDIINPEETKTVTFRDINIAGSFGTLVTLRATVEPVDGEANTGNNTAQYSVIFTID
jgi:hypothetical protein